MDRRRGDGDATRYLIGGLLAVLLAEPVPGQTTAALDTSVVTSAGSGPTTYVLLSGIVGGVHGMRRLQLQLAAHGCRVIVIDPYRLSMADTALSFAAIADRVDRMLDRLGVDSARVAGHAHGAGVALRLAATHPGRVSALFFLDVGALVSNHTKVFSSSLRLIPIIVRIPGGRGFVRGQYVRRLRQNTGHQEWLDAATQRAYTDPMLDHISQVVTMARRLADAKEPETLEAVVARTRVSILLLLGDLPHPSQPDSAEIAALAPLGPLVTVRRLPGVGHFPHEEIPKETARLIIAASPADTVSPRR